MTVSTPEREEGEVKQTSSIYESPRSFDLETWSNVVEKENETSPCPTCL
jgi:hypothetical protein